MIDEEEPPKLTDFAVEQVLAGNGLMSPTRGRVARYCGRINEVRKLAQIAIWLEMNPNPIGMTRAIAFSAAVYHLRSALRQLAFASALPTSDELEKICRYWTSHSHGSYILNMLEASNPGAFPRPIDVSTLYQPATSLQEFVDGLVFKNEQSLSDNSFMWAWRTCKYAENSLDVRSAWCSIANGIRPSHVARALLSLLD